MTALTPSPTVPTRRRSSVGAIIVVVVLTALGTGVGFVVATASDEKWLITAKVLMQVGPETGGTRPSMVGSGAPVLQGNPRREDVQTEVELLNSPDLFQRAFTKFLEEDRPGALGREPRAIIATLRGFGETLGLVPTTTREEHAFDKWTANFRIAVIPSSTMLEVQCRSERPKAAARLIAIMLELYKSDHLAAFGAHGLAPVLTTYVTSRETALAAAEATLGKQRLRYAVVDVVQELTLLLKRRAESEARFAELGAKLAAAHAKVGSLARDLETLPVEQRVSSESRPNPTRDELELRLATARQELTTAQERFTEGSPEVRTAAAAVELLTGMADKLASTREAAIITGRSTMRDTLRERLVEATADEQALAAERSEVRTATAALSERIVIIESNRSTIQRAEMDVDEAKRALVQAHEGERLARIDGVLAENRVANIAVVTPPTWLPTPLRSFGLPMRLAVTLAGLAAGLGLGLLVVLWRRAAAAATAAASSSDARASASS